MELVEFAELPFADWAGLTRYDSAPFGPASARLEYRPKDQHVGVRDDDGRLVAVVGATVAQVTVDGAEPFEVVGIGGLIVHKDFRGLGLAKRVMDRLREITAESGPALAMIFSEPHVLPLHIRRGYTPLSEPVWVDQPAGPIVMPMQAAWRPFRPTIWPAGAVRLHGLPF
jgi:GNAT superfamily N-acetyltransferase